MTGEVITDATTRQDDISIADHWQALVTVALLGTDRRDPPEPIGPIADLVADTARTSPSERMLAHVAACVAVRRAGVLPGPPIPTLQAPVADERPVCSVAASERWWHITTSWPVLEDEWMLALIARGLRSAPELVPPMLARHQRDPVRRARAIVAAGPVAEWLVEHLPSLAPTKPPGEVSPEAFGELPALPIPPELEPLVHAEGEQVGRALAGGFEAGAFGPAHRAVLVNLLARIRPDAIEAAHQGLAGVDPVAPGHGLATVLADLTSTRSRMLAELAA